MVGELLYAPVSRVEQPQTFFQLLKGQFATTVAPEVLGVRILEPLRARDRPPLAPAQDALRLPDTYLGLVGETQNAPSLFDIPP